MTIILHGSESRRYDLVNTDSYGVKGKFANVIKKRAELSNKIMENSTSAPVALEGVYKL